MTDFNESGNETLSNNENKWRPSWISEVKSDFPPHMKINVILFLTVVEMSCSDMLAYPQYYNVFCVYLFHLQFGYGQAAAMLTWQNVALISC